MKHYSGGSKPREGITPIQAEFIEWLLDPHREGTHADFAAAHDVHKATVFGWKKDARFRREWERRAAELNADVERVQDVINAMYRQAVGGDTKAAALYLQFIDRFVPKKVIVTEDRALKDLSDEDLAAEVERHLHAV